MPEGRGLRVERGKRRYKVLLPLTVHVEEGAFVQGDEFEHEFSVEDEWENVDSGLLGLVPETYEVIGDSIIEVNLIEAPAARSVDPVTLKELPTRRVVQPGDVFRAAIPLAREEQLRNHIRRVVQPPANPAKPSNKE